MRRWIHSRRLHKGLLAAIALLTTGACGGAVLANYTVAGMNPVYVARAEPADLAPRRGAADWLADEAFRKAGQDRASAEFADPWKPEPAD